jgi:hypothetical protein
MTCDRWRARSELRGKRSNTQARKSSSQEDCCAKVLLEKGKGVWMHGLKGREEIAGLTGSRARAMDPAIYPTLCFNKPICKKQIRSMH